MPIWWPALRAPPSAPPWLRPVAPKTPTTPKPIRPSLATARPVRPTHPTRTASATAPADLDRLATCLHEAGHAVAGDALDAELQSAYLAPEGILLPGGRKGEAQFRDHPHGTAELIAYAGPWAQAKFQAGGRPTQREFFTVMDTAGAHDARVLTAAGGLHLGAAVVQILERAWPAVQTIARKLYNVGEVHHEDVCAALGISDGGGFHSGQLASLRSGCRSVPPFTTKTPAPAT